MLVNELAQWAVLLFLAIIGFGLTRQLGQFLIPRREQLEYEGPDLQKVLPESLFTAVDFAQVQELARSSPAGLTAVVAIRDNCHGCVQMVEGLHERGSPSNVPLVALVSSASPAFDRRVDAVFDLVCHDHELRRCADASIRATPFVLVVDRELHVLARSISANIEQVIEHWRLQRHELGESVTTGHSTDSTYAPSADGGRK